MVVYSRKRFLHILLLATFSIWSATALAQDKDENDWKIRFAPYLWGIALDGTSTIGALPPLDIDASFSDIISNANYAASFHTEFKKNNWVFVIDPTILSLEVDAVLPLPIPGGAPPITLGIDIVFIEAWAGYEFHKNWEVIGGLRYQEQDITVTGLPSPPFPASPSISEDWSDFFIGTRLKADISDKWFVVWRADVVVAGESEGTSWNTTIFFNRRIRETMALLIGYRHYVDEFNNPGIYQWDITESGPLIGYMWNF